MTDETIAPVQKATEGSPKRGWPKGKPRGPRIAQPEQRAPQRTPQFGGQRTKTGRIKMNDDPYYIDPNTEVPDGMSWQWIAKAVIGKDDGMFRKHFNDMQRQGWRPVDGASIPRFGVTSGEVELGGLVLMERPIEMTQEAVEEDYDKARSQLVGQLSKLDDVPAGTLPRDNRGHRMSSVKRDEAIPVPADNNYERPE